MISATVMMPCRLVSTCGGRKRTVALPAGLGAAGWSAGARRAAAQSPAERWPVARGRRRGCRSAGRRQPAAAGRGSGAAAGGAVRRRGLRLPGAAAGAAGGRGHPAWRP